MGAMPVTERQLNRATLARQLLLRRERLGVVEAVRRVVALQAQEPASPYVALWNRVEGFDPGDLDRAYRSNAVVKSTSVRITLHAVVAEDYPRFHEAMQPTLRASRLNDDRFTVAGLSREQADDVIAELLAYAAEPRSNQEMEAFLDARFGALQKPGVWWAIRTYGPFMHAPNGGTWMFGPRPAYVASPYQQRSGDPELELRHLVRRYLEGFGPASIADIGKFALIPRARVRTAIEALGEEVVRVQGPAKEPLYDVQDGEIPADDTPAPPRLLGMWDEILLAYEDRARIIPEPWRKHVIRTNGDSLPTLLVDGFVAGVWRPAEGGGIEATAFAALSKADWAGLEDEALSLVAFLAPRDPSVYRRYGRWWDKLPASGRRVLGA
jgi:hypothetical protein